MTSAAPVTTFSVLWQSPLLVAKGANTWNTKKVPVGSTFDKCVRMSAVVFGVLSAMAGESINQSLSSPLGDIYIYIYIYI
jgi:hypothetical protein